jgi:hypothetical protein
VQQQVAGNLKYEITDKENSEDKSELLARDGQLSVHCQRRKTYVVPVDKGYDKEQKDKREDPLPQLLNGSRLDCEGVGYVGPATHTLLG